MPSLTAMLWNCMRGREMTPRSHHEQEYGSEERVQKEGRQDIR